MSTHLDDTVMECLTGSEKAEEEAALLKKRQLRNGAEHYPPESDMIGQR